MAAQALLLLYLVKTLVEMSLVARPDIGSTDSSNGHSKETGNIVTHTHCSSDTVAMNVIQPPSFNFHSCSVTINYTTQ
jgi:hypothetical protein